METESLARFKMIPANLMIAPGKCAGCGKFSNDDFLDFGLEVEFYGVVYLCRECLVEAAIVFEYRPAEHYDRMANELAAVKAQLNMALDREEAMKNALASIDTSHLRPRLDSFSFVTVEANEYEGHPNDPIDARESGSDEQGDEQGSPDLQRDDSIESILGGTGFDI